MRLNKNQTPNQSPLALSVPLSRFAPPVRRGSAFFVRPIHNSSKITRFIIMKFKSFIYSKPHSFILVCGVASVLQLGLRAGSAQTNIYLSDTTITLNPGTYDITAYGAQGGNGAVNSQGVAAKGGRGAKMTGRFSFATTVNLRLLVGRAGG